MLQQWEKQFPGRVENIFAALQNVAPSHLADTDLFDFTGLGARNGGQTPAWLPDGKGDGATAWDEDAMASPIVTPPWTEVRLPIPRVQSKL